MKRHQSIINYDLAINEVWVEENLKYLRGENDNYEIKDKNLLVWHSAVTRRAKIKYNGRFNDFKNIDELLLYSDEIMHFTAQLYLYRPYLNNPLRDQYTIGSITTYPNYHNLEAKRYYMYSDIVLQKIYSYWDRIGDLIAAFFPDLITPERVYFVTAFDIIPTEFHDIQSYKWLKEFRENSFKKLNNKRKEIVHYTSSDTQLKYDHLSVSRNRLEIEAWISERNAIPDYFKTQITLSIEGFYQTLSFLEEVDKRLFSDIE